MPHPRTTSRSVVARFLSRGPLERLPKRPDDRDALLELVAWRTLPRGATCDEPSLNLLLRGFTEDTAMLRRAIVDHGLIRRSADGATYTGLVEQPELIIRPATEQDDAEVNRVTVAAYREHFPDPQQPYLRSVATAATARREQAETWVAERGGIIEGAVTLTGHDTPWTDVARPHELEFRLLCIDPAVQGNGLGTELVRRILAAAAEREGIDAVVLTTNDSWTGPQAFYERLGFVRAPERDWVPGDAPDVQLIVYTHPV